MKIHLLNYLLFTLFVLSSQSAAAGTDIWIGPAAISFSGSSAYYSDWSLGHAPTSTDDVVINYSVTGTLNPGTYTFHSITLNNNATMVAYGSAGVSTTIVLTGYAMLNKGTTLTLNGYSGSNYVLINTPEFYNYGTLVLSGGSRMNALSTFAPPVDPTLNVNDAQSLVGKSLTILVPTVLGVAVTFWMVRKGAKVIQSGSGTGWNYYKGSDKDLASRAGLTQRETFFKGRDGRIRKSKF